VTPPREPVMRLVERRFAGAEMTRLAGDGSSRTFYRVRPRDGSSVVLMDYGEPFYDETDDIRLARIFDRARLPIARILDVEPDPGCLILDDLGDICLESRLRNAPGGGPPPLLRDAVELAAAVADRGTPVLADSPRAAGPALDAERFRYEMDFFLEHFVVGLRGGPPPSGELRQELHHLAETAADTPRRVLCHRDFHSRNLMLRPDGALVMVDIQDARWGPDSYDLASILRDAYAPLEDAWIDPLIDHYLDRVGGRVGRAEFRERFQIVAAQRMIKALGSFGYLTRAGRTRYKGAIAPTLERLSRLLPGFQPTRRLHGLLVAEGILQG